MTTRKGCIKIAASSRYGRPCASILCVYPREHGAYYALIRLPAETVITSAVRIPYAAFRHFAIGHGIPTLTYREAIDLRKRQRP